MLSVFLVCVFFWNYFRLGTVLKGQAIGTAQQVFTGWKSFLSPRRECLNTEEISGLTSKLADVDERIQYFC